MGVEIVARLAGTDQEQPFTTTQENADAIMRGILDLVAARRNDEHDPGSIEIIARYGGREEKFNPTPEQAERLLAVLESRNQVAPTQIPLTTIKNKVCGYLQVKPDLLERDTRKREVVYARQMVCYFAKKLTEAPLRAIGGLIGDRDHTTVIYSIKTIKDLWTTDHMTRRHVADLEGLLV